MKRRRVDLAEGEFVMIGQTIVPEITVMTVWSDGEYVMAWLTNEEIDQLIAALEEMKR